MADYVIISRAASEEGAAALREAERSLARADWRAAIPGPGLQVWVSGGPPLPVAEATTVRGVIVGRLLRRNGGGALMSAADAGDGTGPRAAALRLCTEGWGAYVAVWTHSSGDPGRLAVFRDPSGGVEAFSWTRAGLRFVGSTVPPALAHLTGRVSIRWDRVAAWLTETTEIAGPAALEGVEALAAGEFRADASSAGEMLWRPADLARRGAYERRRPAELAPQLEAVIDGAVASLAAFGARALVEVSGGLDSAVVASAVSRNPNLNVGTWLNYRGTDRGADETAYAKAMTERIGTALTIVDKPEVQLQPDDLIVAGGGVRPGLNAMDPHYDRDVLARAQACGTEAVLTGQGGDTVFFAALPEVLASELSSDPRRGGSLHSLAMALQTSVRSLVTSGREGLLNPPTRLGARLWAAHDDLVAPAPSVPWMIDLDGLTPAKRLQILQLGHCLLYRTPCRRNAALNLVHVPLLQPIVEACLALPIERLTLGDTRRALLKRAFAQRLPAAILNRRSKGDLTAYYGRMIARSLELLRPYLLDGLLASNGLLDRGRLEERLDVSDLAWRGGYADIMDLVAVEAWVRHWSSRNSAVTPS